MGITVIDYRVGRRVYNLPFQKVMKIVEDKPYLDYTFTGDVFIIYGYKGGSK